MFFALFVSTYYWILIYRDQNTWCMSDFGRENNMIRIKVRERKKRNDKIYIIIVPDNTKPLYAVVVYWVHGKMKGRVREWEVKLVEMQMTTIMTRANGIALDLSKRIKWNNHNFDSLVTEHCSEEYLEILFLLLALSSPFALHFAWITKHNARKSLINANSIQTKNTLQRWQWRRRQTMLNWCSGERERKKEENPTKTV